MGKGGLALHNQLSLLLMVMFFGLLSAGSIWLALGWLADRQTDGQT